MMKLGLDSFSCNLHMEHPEEPKDIRWFLDLLLELGLDGCQVDPRHLKGWDLGILRTASGFCREHALYLELGTGGFGFEDISMKLQLARDAGARSLRTFYGGHRHLLSAEDIRRMVREAAEGLKRLADVAAASDVILAIENHEEFTGAEVVEIIRAVDSPYVQACLDTGNGMMVGEDPLECTRALAPHAACVHLKDWVVVQEDGAPRWEDRPLGQGDASAAEAYAVIRAAQPGIPVTIENPTWGSRRPRTRADERASLVESVRFARSLEGTGTAS